MSIQKSLSELSLSALFLKYKISYFLFCCFNPFPCAVKKSSGYVFLVFGMGKQPFTGPLNRNVRVSNLSHENCQEDRNRVVGVGFFVFFC